jgi:hypothetical protein
MHAHESKELFFPVIFPRLIVFGSVLQMDGQRPLPHTHPKDKEKQKSIGDQTTLFNKDASI